MRSRKTVRTRFRAAIVVPALGAAVLLAACSPGVEYPSVLDRPEPRADAPMSPDQVKEVTNSLISDRDQLSSEVKPTAQASAPAGRQSAPATTASTPAAGSAPNP